MRDKTFMRLSIGQWNDCRCSWTETGAVEEEVSTRENAFPLAEQKQQFVPTLQFLSRMWNQQFPITSLPRSPGSAARSGDKLACAVGKPLISRCGVARLGSAA
jgi:hypothetical protein